MSDKTILTQDELYLIQIAVRSYISHDMGTICRYEELSKRMKECISVIDKVTEVLKKQETFDIF